MNFALLGNIAFDLLNAPSALDEKRSATFVEHAVLAGKPRLQSMGDNLTEITLQLRLHYQLAPVESRYQALVTAKEKQAPLALVLGFSHFKGHFVITELSSQTLFADEKGNALAREVSLTLREFVGNTTQGIVGTALALNGHSPLASLLPKGLSNFVSKTAQLVSKGITVYRQTRQAINSVRETLTVMKTLIQRPLDALGYLPTLVGQLDSSLGGLADMLGLSEAFSVLSQGLKGATPFLVGLQELSEHLNTAQREFKLGLKDRNLGAWFDLGVKAIDNADEVMQSMMKPAAQLTAWIAIRGDSPAPSQEIRQWTV